MKGYVLHPVERDRLEVLDHDAIRNGDPSVRDDEEPVSPPDLVQPKGEEVGG